MNRSTTTVLSALVLSIGLLLQGSKAAADLPQLYCEKGFYGPDLVWCIGYQNNFVSVSVGNAADHDVVPEVAPFKLELVRYPSRPRDGVDGHVMANRRTDLITLFWPHPVGVARTEPLWTIEAGYYCVRRYTPHDGFWEDIFCVSDTGGYSLGKTGYGLRDQ